MITLQLQFSSKYHINNLAVQTIWQAIVFEITVGDRRLPVKCIKCPDIFLQILMKTSGQNCALVINELLIVYQQSQLFYYFSNPWRYHAETNVERIMLKLYFPFHHLFPPFFSFLPIGKHVSMEDKNLHYYIIILFHKPSKKSQKKCHV